MNHSQQAHMPDKLTGFDLSALTACEQMARLADRITADPRENALLLAGHHTFLTHEKGKLWKLQVENDTLLMYADLGQWFPIALWTGEKLMRNCAVAHTSGNHLRLVELEQQATLTELADDVIRALLQAMYGPTLSPVPDGVA